MRAAAVDAAAGGPSQPLRVAVVGAGWMGEAHLRAYAAQRDVRIVGLVTRTPARAAELSSRYPIGATFDDVEAMLDATAPHAISVTTAEHDHVAPACAALERGIGVLVEKPMASSLEDARRIADAAASSGAVLMPAHVLRFTLPYQALVRAVRGGHLGTVRAIASRRDRTIVVAERSSHVHPALVLSVHDIDLIHWISGSRVRRVRALESRRHGAAQPDAMWAQLELDGDTIATVSTAMLHPRDSSITSSDRLDVYGERGVATVDLGAALLTIDTQPAVQPPDWLLEPPDGGGAFGAEIGHFCDRLRLGRASDVVSVDDALAGIRVAEAMIGSARAGGTIIEL